MADNTRLKELSNKVDNLIAVVDQREEKFKLLQQSLAIVTKYIEAQHEGGPSDTSLEVLASAHQELMVCESR